jgi:hypothetical protein
VLLCGAGLRAPAQLFGAAEKTTLTEAEPMGETGSTHHAPDQYPAVLLDQAVADFTRLTGNLSSHQVVVGDAVYPQPCVYLVTHLVEMRAAGWKDVDFDTLVAVSGASALFAYQPGEFMPKYANLTIGMDDRIAKATGFGYEWVPFEGAEGAWEVVKESVDSGRPVKGWYWENLLVAGYQDAAREEDRKLFVMADGPDTIAEWWTWQQFEEWTAKWPPQFGRHTARVETLSESDIALRVMRDLVAWSASPPDAARRQHPEAKFGLQGIEAYAADCADTETYQDWLACHDINPQWTVRRSTALYLQRVAAAALFPAPAGERIGAAAREYRAAYDDWQELYRQLGHDAPADAGKTKERRLAGAAAVRSALAHEKAALAELTQALKIATADAGAPRMLEGLTAKPRWATHMGCVEGCLEFLGRKISPAWLYGATGYAFALNVHEQLCPSAPYEWNRGEPDRLGRNLGYLVETVANQSDDDMAEKREEAWRMAREAIDSGIPCYAFDIGPGDYFVIPGYDDTGYYWKAGDETKGPVPWQALGTTGIVGLVLVSSVTPAEPADDAKTVGDALRFALDLQQKGSRTPADAVYMPGLRGYDHWIRALEAGDSNPHGASFNAQFWAECRRFAVDFLQEAKQRLGDRKLDPLFDEATAHYQVVAQNLNRVAELFPMDGKWEPRLKDQQLCREAIASLRAARQAEERGLAALAKIVQTGGVLRAESVLPNPDVPIEESTMAPVAQDLTHGFRHDPMQFLQNDRTLQGALVRTFVFQQPHEADSAIIRAEMDKILAEQREDGTFGDTSKATGERLLRLLELGLPHDRPEVQRAAEAILRQKRAGQNANEWVEKEGALSIYPLHALCLLGRRDVPEVDFSLRWYIEHPEEWNDAWQGCPWTPEVFWSALWAGRRFAPVEDTVNDGLRRVAEGTNAAGCNAYNDPWGFTDAAGRIHTPQARALLQKQVPMILRGQRPDGGWGDHSLAVFRALKTHGLLDPLRNLPALPPDWRVARSIPAPDGDLSSMTWDGRHLWVYDRASNQAIAVSPDDGKVTRHVKLPIAKAWGIGWWGDALAVTQTDPKRLLQLDPTSGQVKREVAFDAVEWIQGVAQVDGKLYVADGFNCNVLIVDPADPAHSRSLVLAGPGPAMMAADGDAVWHADFWAPAIIKTDPEGKLLDWGDQPFAVRGLAFDGQRLWALDASAGRICVIERAG